jgi:hypothetical protein
MAEITFPAGQDVETARFTVVEIATGDRKTNVKWKNANGDPLPDQKGVNTHAWLLQIEDDPKPDKIPGKKFVSYDNDDFGASTTKKSWNEVDETPDETAEYDRGVQRDAIRARLTALSDEQYGFFFQLHNVIESLLSNGRDIAAAELVERTTTPDGSGAQKGDYEAERDALALEIRALTPQP